MASNAASKPTRACKRRLLAANGTVTGLNTAQPKLNSLKAMAGLIQVDNNAATTAGALALVLNGIPPTYPAAKKGS